MNFENIKEFIPTSADFLSILPEFSLLCFAMLSLILSSLLAKYHYKKIGALSVILTSVSLVIVLLAKTFCPVHAGEGSFYFAGTLSSFGFFTSL